MRPSPPSASFLDLGSVLLALAGATAAAGADLPRNPTRYDFSALPAAMSSEIAAGSPAGFTLMIVKDDQVVFEHAVGTRTLASVMPIASASKMPSTTVIMHLVSLGLMGLDDRVADHLPFWPQSAADPKSAITIRQCVSCTSGLPFTDTYVGDASLTLDTAVQGIATLPLDFAPGTQFGYTGNGFHVAGCVAEHVSGKSWAQLVQEVWSGPLSLATFSYGATSNPRIAGGVSCKTEDYARILAVHLARGRYLGTRVLAATTVDRMRQDEFVNQGITTIFSSPGQPGWHYGLSWWISTYAGSGAPTEISDQGAFGTTPWIDLGRGYAAVMLMQSTTPTGTRIWNRLEPAIEAAIDARRDLVVVRPATATVSGADVALAARGGAWGPESATTYTWSVVSAPAGATSPTFPANGGNDAQSCLVTLAPGAWTLRVAIAAPSAPSLSRTSDVTVTVAPGPGSGTGTAGATSGSAGTTGSGGSGAASTTGSGGGSGSSGGVCGLGGGLAVLLLAGFAALRLPRRR